MLYLAWFCRYCKNRFIEQKHMSQPMCPNCGMTKAVQTSGYERTAEEHAEDAKILDSR